MAIRRYDAASPADHPTVTVAARALFGTPNEHFGPGTYFLDEVDGYPTPRIFVTLGDGWVNTQDKWGVLEVGAGFLSFSHPDRVFWTPATRAAAITRGR